MQKYIYSFSFIADRRVAFDPPVNLSADLRDEKAVPAHANETRHLQNTEHRFPVRLLPTGGASDVQAAR